MKENQEASFYWHTLDPFEISKRFASDMKKGHSQTDATKLLAKFGPNEIPETKQKSIFKIFFRQFSDFMIIVLLIAAVVAGIVGEPYDSLAILVIIFLNAIVGMVQEYKAEQAVAALRMMASPDARVRRNGSVHTIAENLLVPGDIVILEAGNIVPADMRLIELANLRVEEAALTGESVAIYKDLSTLKQRNLPLGDQVNMAFKGTQVSYGRGLGIVVATGMQTQLGQIALLLSQEKAVKTPLQRRLELFGRKLAFVILAIATVIFVVGLLRGEALIPMFLTAVSLAVAAIPEALPAVVTMSLAFGARKMSQRKALVRRLPAVETLGSITYICSDKTGTLTENKMHLESLWVNHQIYNKLPTSNGTTSINLLGQALALNNDSELSDDQTLLGDPTEVALRLGAQSSGFYRNDLKEVYPRVAEIPFDSTRKLMSTLHQDDEGIIVFVKGAPEMLLENCHDQLINDQIQAFDAKAVLSQSDDFASLGYRVLAFAYKRLKDLPSSVESKTVERDLTFLGLVALIDPPRKEVPDAVRSCCDAGITPVMITGDHPQTALAIAHRIGIASKEARVITGVELAKMNDQKLATVVRDISVYARVSPQQKIRIVKALQQQGEYVSMTGDGVNDAPSLKSADIGIAMGEKGTDVARKAADLVLLDDNFATIVKAIREGRRIFTNIRKFIKYTMTSNTGEILTLFLAPFLGLPIPLIPIQILWINLVTDGLPGLALSAEPEERSIMKQPPRPPGESIFEQGMWQHMLWAGLLIGSLSLISQAWAIYNQLPHWQTMVFTTLTLSQLAHVMAIRSQSDSIFSIGLFSNPLLLGAVILTFLLQMMVIYLPIFQPIFKTSPLSFSELLICIGLASLVFVAVEVEKFLVRRGLLYQGR